jgi:hypothetical protein
VNRRPDADGTDPRALGRLFGRVGAVVAARPLSVLLVAVLLIGAAGAGAAAITSVTGTEAFIPEDPTLAAFEESFDGGAVAVLVRGDVTDPATMRAIDRFDRRMTGVDDVATVATPADRVRATYGRIPGSRADIERVVDPADSAVVSVVLVPDLSQEEERIVYERTLEGREWAAFPAGVSVTVTGSPAFSAQLAAVIQSSTQEQLALAVGLMVVALFFLFRGVRLRLLPIVAVFVGVIYTFGAMGYLGIPNSTLTSAVFPILIGLGIDYSVQFHQRYTEELERAPPHEALPRALAGIGPAVTVAMLAAALGFGATWISGAETPAFVWFAQASMVGVLMTFLTATVVLLPTLTLVGRWRGWAGPETHADGSGAARRGDEAGAGGVGSTGRALGRLARESATRPALVFLVAGLLFVGGAYAGTTLDTMTDSEEFIPQDLPALVDLEQFRAQTGGGTDVEYDVLVTGSVREPGTLRWMEEFADAASASPLVERVETPATAIRAASGGELPTTEAGVERAIARLPPEQREQFVDGGRARLVVIGQPDLTTEQIVSLSAHVRDAVDLSRPPPGVSASVTGQTVVFAPSVIERIDERNLTTLLGVALVFSLLLLYYRHPVKATAPLVPMLFVVGWQSLYMAGTGVRVSPLGATLGALTVGIGAEYTVIVMERYYEERARGATPLDAIQVAGERVGTAISVSGMTTVLGFSALVVSSFPIVADFGVLTVGVIGLTLVAALVVLPPTLVLFDETAAAARRWLGAGGRSGPVRLPEPSGRGRGSIPDDD